MDPKFKKILNLVWKTKFDRANASEHINQMFILEIYNEMMGTFADDKMKQIIHNKFINQYKRVSNMPDEVFADFIEEENSRLFYNKPSEN
jgi:hypothetical protein